jgi:hypothetical protein
LVFGFNGIDMTFQKENFTLIVKACIERESAPKREDFLALMDNLNKKYKKRARWWLFRV